MSIVLIYIRLTCVLFISLVASIASAAPVVSSVTSPSGSLGYNVEVTVSGSGFGTKGQSNPIFYDLTDKAYENGVLNTYQSSYSEGQTVPTRSQDAKSIWYGGSPNMVDITYKNAHRHSKINSHYSANGGNRALGWPMAYGGQNTPSGNQKIYVSWWYKPLHQPRWYWSWGLSNINGKFINGATPFDLAEKLVINTKQGVVQGELVYLDGNTMHFIAPGIINSGDLDGQTVKGATSGATAVLSGSFVSPGSASSKFTRIWEEGTGKNGLRASWTQMHTTLLNPAGGTVTFWKGVDDLIVREWNHFEVELDLDANFLRSWLNNKPIADMDISGGIRNNSAFSPTLALVGTNGKMNYMGAQFGEIYMDNTLQRVVIADAPKWSDVTHSEVQYPVAWSNTNVRFRTSLGSLENADPSRLYVYVFDVNGQANPSGVRLCTTCNAPPDYPANIQ